jgi:hypothetical protein
MTLGTGARGVINTCNVIGHHDVIVELVVGQFSLVIVQRFHDHPGDLRPAQVKGTGADAVEQAIHSHKSPAVGCGRWEDAAGGETAMQAPSQENGLAGGIEVRQTARMKSRHKAGVRLGDRDSQEKVKADWQSAAG